MQAPGASTASCLVSQSCLILWDHMDYSPPGSSVHEISQARIPEWAAISFSKSPALAADSLPLSHQGSLYPQLPSANPWAWSGLVEKNPNPGAHTTPRTSEVWLSNLGLTSFSSDFVCNQFGNHSPSRAEPRSEWHSLLNGEEVGYERSSVIGAPTLMSVVHSIPLDLLTRGNSANVTVGFF